MCVGFASLMRSNIHVSLVANIQGHVAILSCISRSNASYIVNILIVNIFRIENNGYICKLHL